MRGPQERWTREISRKWGALRTVRLAAHQQRNDQNRMLNARATPKSKSRIGTWPIRGVLACLELLCELRFEQFDVRHVRLWLADKGSTFARGGRLPPRTLAARLEVKSDTSAVGRLRPGLAGATCTGKYCAKGRERA